MPIRLSCPSCRREVELQRDARQPQPCPHCQAVIVVPKAPRDAGASDRRPPVAPGHQAHAPTEVTRELADALKDPGRRFGRYVVLSELGRGGVGAVHRAFDERLRRIVALKTLLEPLDQDSVRRFRREAEAVARLQHPNIVAVHDAGEANGTHWVAMELVVGETLKRRLEPTGEGNETLSMTAGLEVMRDVARAVQYAHEQGVLHRDLKPENVIVDAHGRPHVLDFGLARFLDVRSKLTKSGTTVGTPAYMPPEQMGDSESVDERSDVYSLGATLYHVLTGRPPFEGATEVNVLSAVLQKAPVPPSAINPEVSAELETICLRCLEKTRERRYSTAGELAGELERYLASHHATPETRTGRRLVAGLASVALLAVVGVAAAFLLRGLGASAPSAPGPGATATLVATPTPTPPRRATPDWYEALPEGERPGFPLPAGLAFGREQGVYTNEKDKSELVYIHGGSFRMGSESDETSPAHDVTVSGYFLGRFEVTVEQFEAFVAATGYKTVAELQGSGRVTLGYDNNPANQEVLSASFRLPAGAEWQATAESGWTPAAKSKDPVAQVAWTDVDAYCTWAGLSLPTEAQWELAASWDPVQKKARPFPWGWNADPATNERKPANLLDNAFLSAFLRGREYYKGYNDGYAGAAPVGSFPDGISPWKCHDMGGNVREWIRDVYDVVFYRRSPRQDPVAEAQPPLEGMPVYHVVRGASFACSAQWAPSWKRSFAPTDFRAWDLGFRVARKTR